MLPFRAPATSFGVALLAITGGQLVAQTTAISAGTTTQFPGASGDFEYTAVTANNFLYGPSFPSGSTSWTPWTMGAGTGIANNGSGFTSQNPNAPGPTRVAFIQGTGSISTPFTFAAGSWRLKFKGAQRDHLGINRQVVKVSIGSTEVFEQELVGEIYLPYTTRVISFGSTTTTTVTFQGMNPHGGDNTAFLDQIELEPIAEWSRAVCWDNGVPTSGMNAIIPSGVEIVMRTTNLQAATVLVEGELLTSFANADLTTRWVAVMGDGARFEVGRELTPFDQTFALKLIGDNTSETAHGAGTKFLMAMDSGTIEMHGTPRGISTGDGHQRTWTKLATTANASTSTLTLAEAVNWNVDDEIVVAGSNTIGASYVDQAEKHKIQSISGGGTVLTLYSSLAHKHFGASSVYNYSNGTRSWNLERSAEVGLLTHNVKVEGVLGSNTTFGGHVMLMRGSCCTSGTGGRGYFSNVEFYQLGQKQMLGRYPIHWHMQLAQGAGQFAKSCSVHKSFNRAITVHGTDSTLVEGNVAYDHAGHGIFLEDASEQNNEFYYNLALSTVRPASGHEMLPSDNSHDEMQNRSPATYWITNPNNTFVGNVAAGTRGTGFWFILPEAVTGLSATLNLFPTLYPNQLELGLFENNVAHSCSSGFDVHDGIDQSHNILPNVPWIPAGSANQNFDGLTVYGCWLGLYAGFGGDLYERLRFRENVLADNYLNIVFAAYNVVESSAIVARTASGLYTGVAVGYVVYDGASRLFDSHIVGFTSGGESFFGEVGAATKHTGHRMHGLSFDPVQIPSTAFPDFDGATPNYNDVHDEQEPRRWGIAVVDEDGTLCGRPGWTIISNHEMMRSLLDIPNGSVSIPQWSNTYASPFSFAHLRIYHPGLDTSYGPPPGFDDLPEITLSRFLVSHSPVSFVNDYQTDPHKQHPVIVNDPSVSPSSPVATYTVDWTALPTSPAEVQVHLDDLIELPNGTYATVLLGGVGGLTGLAVDRPNGSSVTLHTNYTDFLNDTVTSCFKDTTIPGRKPLWIKFVKPSGGMIEKLRVQW